MTLVADNQLELRGLAKAYGKRAVLGPIDLVIPAGTLVSVLGTNGAGKSTLLGSIAGVLRHTGRVSYAGASIRPGDGCAYLPQRMRFPARATGDETLGLFRQLVGQVVDRATPADGFLPEGARRMEELSGGQAQRVALACAVMGPPRILLLDEPFANLDEPSRAEATRLLRAHRDAGATVLVASPAAADVLSICDRSIAIEAGGLVGPIESIT